MKKILLFLIMITFLNAGTKVALVVGNSEYDIKPLPNAVNDAKDIRDSLIKLGYKVIDVFNVTKKEFENAIYAFSIEAKKADIAIFFYAGHAIQNQGENYLNPIDNNRIIRNDAEFSNFIKLSNIIEKVKVAKKFSAVFLDACRENPTILPEEIRISRSTNQTRGLVQVVAPAKSNIIISFATQAGEVAFDGEGDNSPYSLALKKLITTNQDIRFMLGKVKDTVMASTKDYVPVQIPTTYGTLGGKQYCITESCSETTFMPLGVTPVGSDMYETKPSTAKFTWQEAQQYCERKTLGEHHDWKLPTKDNLKKISNIELFTKEESTKREIWSNWFKNRQKSLLEKSKEHGYFLQHEFIENVPQEGDFWTSTSYDSKKAWAISFKDGIIYTDKKLRKRHVYCSRTEEEKSIWDIFKF